MEQMELSLTRLGPNQVQGLTLQVLQGKTFFNILRTRNGIIQSIRIHDTGRFKQLVMELFNLRINVLTNIITTITMIINRKQVVSTQ